MKLHRTIIALVTLLLVSLTFVETQAATDADFYEQQNSDSIEVSLLTCAPGEEVYSLYGHTAIRYTDASKGIDIAINYGMFSFHKPYFVPRFILGLTDYEMGIMTFTDFKEEYRRANRYVIQQVLNLTPAEKASFIKAVEENYLPQNRIYRYNYFYDNCTTRARDILFKSIDGKVEFADTLASYPSYRALIHEYNKLHPWARFGNDILLGVSADRKTSLYGHQFLPFLLSKDIQNAKIRNSDGTSRPLVLKQFNVVEDNEIIEDAAKSDTVWFRPFTCACAFLIIVLGVTFAEYKTGCNFWAFDAVVMLATGLLGIVLFVMLFSQHPTTSTNLQILLLNPLPLIYMWRAVKKLRQRQADRFFKISAPVIVIFMLLGIFQDYAEGMYVLALSLLLRSLWTAWFKFNVKKNGE